MTKTLSLSLIIPLLFTQFPAVNAQNISDCAARGELVQVRDRAETVTERDGKREAVLSYDIYDRVTFISEELPLGYSAVTGYEWYPHSVLDREYSEGKGWCSYRAQEREEFGKLFKDGEERASYEISFAEDGSVLSKTHTGGRFVWFVLTLLVPLLGGDVNDQEGRAWTEERFGEE